MASPRQRRSAAKAPVTRKPAMKDTVGDVIEHPKARDMSPDERRRAQKAFVKQCVSRGMSANDAVSRSRRKYPGPTE